MAGYSKELADWVEGVLSKHNIRSSRQAENSVDGVLSYATLNNMRNGRKVSAQSVILFADKFGISPDIGLRACGYVGMADAVESSTSVGENLVLLPPANEGLSKGDELTYEPLDHDEEELVSFYRGIPPIMQPAAKAALKAILDSMPDGEDFGTFGKKAE
jgi:hypothetical protein